VNGRDTIRLTALGAPDLLAELAPGAGDPPDGRAPEVRPLDVTTADRRDGRRRYEVTVDGWVVTVVAESATRAALRERATSAAAASGATASSTIRAQIPGRVVRVWVAVGDVVEAGQRLLAIEAMKMENEVRSPRSGTVEAVPVAVGQAAELNETLVVIG
jgi:oxaloacetate decarboxylase alpha subunit